MDPQLGNAYTQQVYGGVQIQITANPEIMSMLTWWREWGPVFANPNPAVQSSLQEVKTLHAISKPI